MINYKESGIAWIGNIPKVWGVCRTKNKFRSTKRIVGDKHIETERLALTLNGVIRRSKESTDGLQPEKFDTYQYLFKNELVFKLIDLNNTATSRVGLSSFNGMVSPAYIILKNNSLDNRFYYYYFLSMWHRNIFNSLGDNGVRSSLNSDELLNIPIPFISVSEQVKISDFLDKKCNQIDMLISLEQKEIEKLKEYKQSKINVVVSKGLVKTNIMEESGIEWIGQFPTGWNITRLKYIGKLSGGISSLKPENFGFGYPFVNYKNIYKNYVLDQNIEEKINTTLEERKKYNIKYGDLFFTGSSETIDELGYSCVALSDFPNAVYNGFCIRMRPYSFVNYNPKYFLYLTRSHICRNFLSANDNSITRANLSQSRLGGMPIIFPNLKEQEKSVKYLDNLCQKVEDLILIKQSKIEELQNYKKSLIYEYVTGKKRCV